VAVEHPATKGDHVRLAGGDLAAGDEVFSLGTELTAAHIGVLASIGVTQIRVIPAPRVGVLSTGDELIAAGPLAPGQIRDSNRPMLLGLVRESGFVPVDLGQVGDDEDLIVDTLRPALLECDAILTSGGVSVGDYDFVKAALNRLGSLEWRQVAIKPAKPLAFGVISGTPIFGLPGNPVSSLVSYELFARPALRQMSGHQILHRPTVSARAEHDFTRRPDGKVHFVRVQVRWSESGYVVASSGEQASNVLSATARANGLARIPDGNGVTAGDSVSVVLWRA
jgi:molybdenum cofactor synthesis domain-containing protein